jgi:Arc/MetJ family transcription regulator
MRGDNLMRTNIELDDVLVEKAMKITQITTKKAVIHKALEDMVKSYSRKEMLKYFDSGIWEGNLEEMRAMR